MSIVLDSSATLAWVHGDETTPAVEALFDRIAEHGAVVPRLWHLEVANALSSALRRQRLTQQDRDGILADLADLDISVDEETERHAWTSTVSFADAHRLSVYDATYLELAKRRQLPLATLDRDLIRAALAEGIEVVGL